jgi:hypothetical protein
MCVRHGRVRRAFLCAGLVISMATSGAAAAAQTPFVPYFGKNQIRYDTFKWQIYTTEHFEIYYYPEIEPHLERIAGYAESAYQHQFDRYLKERFKPFRDKERPADYGRALGPEAGRGRYANVLSAEPSPSGDLVAVMTGNTRDRELDILLLSMRDGSVVRNLTSGFDQSLGFEHIPTPGMRFVTVPWMSWSPEGDRLAYFARTEKDRSLILQNVLTKKIEARISTIRGSNCFRATFSRSNSARRSSTTARSSRSV